jgi:hemerythrin-like domain-containing protein
MNAIQFLKQQHEEAKRGFEELESSSEAQRGQLWSALKPELELHEQIEETCLYGPVAQESARDNVLEQWPKQHHAEIDKASQLIRSISGLEPRDRAFLDQVKQLHSALDQHIRTEEQEIWPRIERAWDSARLDRAGAEMESMKRDKGKKT